MPRLTQLTDKWPPQHCPQPYVCGEDGCCRGCKGVSHLPVKERPCPNGPDCIPDGEGGCLSFVCSKETM